MSMWEALNIENKVEGILLHAEGHPDEHHFGSPFMTAYQLAIAYAHLYPDDVQNLGLPLGGEGTGVSNSFSQYLA